MKQIARDMFSVGLSSLVWSSKKLRAILVHMSRATAVLLLAFGSLTISLIATQYAHATTANMILFWASGTVPSGWTEITSTYNNEFPRGEDPSNFGTTGGSSTRAPTVATETMTTTTPNPISSGGTNPAHADDTHTHPLPTTTMSSISNSPAYCNLRLIEYTGSGGGIPATIPSGAIAMFDSTPGLPGTGWSRLSNLDNRFIRVSSSSDSCTSSPVVSDGGSDTHTNTVTWNGGSGTLGASSGSQKITGCLLGCTRAAPDGHTHTFPTSTTSATTTSIPAYNQPLLAQATTNLTTANVGFIAMFNGDPGPGWTVGSSSGGVFYQKFLRPSSTYSDGTSTTNNSFTESGLSATSGPSVQSGSNAESLLGGPISSVNHTHTVSVTFNSMDIQPPYFNVVIAEKVFLVVTHYRWYVDPGSGSSNNVTDPWSSLNLAADTPISPLPVAEDPPDLTRQLRLRVQILISGNAITLNSIGFALQYEAGSGASNCTSGTWSDVDVGGSGTGAWRYGTSSITDGSTLTSSVFASSKLEQYIKSSSAGTNPQAAGIGDTMEYDFHIQDNAAVGASYYSFRVIQNDGTPISQYNVCPTLSTKPQTAQLMRHGLFFQEGSKQGFEWAK